MGFHFHTVQNIFSFPSYLGCELFRNVSFGSPLLEGFSRSFHYRLITNPTVAEEYIYMAWIPASVKFALWFRTFLYWLVFSAPFYLKTQAASKAGHSPLPLYGFLSPLSPMHWTCWEKGCMEVDSHCKPQDSHRKVKSHSRQSPTHKGRDFCNTQRGQGILLGTFIPW